MKHFVIWLIAVNISITNIKNCIAYDTTVIEDVVTSYNFDVLGDLVRNSSKSVKEMIGNLSKEVSRKLREDLEKYLTYNLIGSASNWKDMVKMVQENFMKFDNLIKEHRDKIANANENIEEYKSRIKDIANLYERNTNQTLKIIEKSFDRIMDNFYQRLSNISNLIEAEKTEEEKSLSINRRLSKYMTAGDCQDLMEIGFNSSGVYNLQKFGRNVFCDMEADDGGWLVIQKRMQMGKQVNFREDWSQYKEGFGQLTSEFWIGNEFLHVLTNQKEYEVLIRFRDYEKGPYFASYTFFKVGSESTNYELDLGLYSGNASDAFKYHHGQMFSTSDRDNDKYEQGNCADLFTGGWWYDRCYDAHLNGVFPTQPDRQNASFITWWANFTGDRFPLVLDEVTIKMQHGNAVLTSVLCYARGLYNTVKPALVMDSNGTYLLRPTPEEGYLK